MGPYEWHYTDEDDRSWLNEAMTNHDYANPSTAISMNSNNMEGDIFKFSIIGSENRNNIVWIAQRVSRIKSTITINAIAIHTAYRNQDYIRVMGREYLNWLKTSNPWNVEYLEIITGASFSAGTGLFGGSWHESQIEEKRFSKIRLSEL